MAYTKILVIKSRLDKRVSYAINEEKTSLSASMDYVLNKDKTNDSHVVFESTINCIKGTAYQNMIKIKRRYHKEGGIQGYHIIQSFKPNELTPEQAHGIGVKFAQKCFGDKYQVVIGTHLDKEHLHNHIIMNSVSIIDGKKYRNNFKDYFRDIRGVSDELCRRYGLSVIKEYGDDKSLTYIEWLARKNKRASWQTIIRLDIDDCIKQAFNYGNFLVLMEHKGYEIKQGKYISFRPYGKERFSREYKLGNEYSRENIINRIEGKDLANDLHEVKNYTFRKQNNLFPKGRIIGIKALYVHYLYLLGLVKNNKLPDKAAFVLKEDLLKFETMTKTFDFLTDRNLKTVQQVENYKAKCNETIELLNNNQNENKTKIKEKSEIYEALVTIKMLESPYYLYLDGYTAMKQEHDAYIEARNILINAGYKSEIDIERLEKEKSEITDAIAKTGNDIRHFRYEIRMCNKAVSGNQHIERKLDDLNSENQVQRREIEYEPS